MRLRIKQDYTTTEVDQVMVLAVKPAPMPGTVPFAYQEDKVYAAMLDEETIGYKRLSAQGQLFFKPMYQEEITCYCEPAVWDAKYIDKADLSNYFWLGQKFSPSHPPALLSNTTGTSVDSFLEPYQSERDVAIAKAWANVDESELLAYATLGELPETAKWIASLYQRGIGILGVFHSREKSLKMRARLERMSSLDQADALANLWLEMRYALRPLMFEMEQIVNALNRGGTKELRKTARGFHNKVESISFPDRETAALKITVGVTGSITRQSDYRAGVLYSVNLLEKDWLSVLGFDKPLEAVYELTKLSFLLDWFFNIGDVLATLTPNAHLTPLGSWIKETHVFRYNQFYSDWYHDDPKWDHDTVRDKYGIREGTHRIIRRTISPDKPVLPSMRINLNLAKCLDLAAIARGFYKSFSRL